MWVYKTEKFKIDNNSEISVDDKLNEYGKESWEAFSIENTPYYDSRLQIRNHKIQTGVIYQVRFKKHI